MEVQIFEKHENYAKIQKTIGQGKFINDLAELICSRTSCNVHAIKGFIYRSCRKWQIKNQRYFTSVIGLNTADSFRFWIQLSSIIFTELTRRVIQGEAEWELDSILSNAFTLYAKQFCND